MTIVAMLLLAAVPRPAPGQETPRQNHCPAGVTFTACCPQGSEVFGGGCWIVLSHETPCPGRRGVLEHRGMCLIPRMRAEPAQELLVPTVRLVAGGVLVVTAALCVVFALAARRARLQSVRKT